MFAKAKPRAQEPSPDTEKARVRCQWSSRDSPVARAGRQALENILTQLNLNFRQTATKPVSSVKNIAWDIQQNIVLKN